MESDVINVLNDLLKSEEMSVSVYDRYIQSVDDRIVKDEFLRIKQNHNTHASELADRVNALGGKPQHNTGFAGFIANARLAINEVKNKNPIDTLKKAYDGEDRGVITAETVLNVDMDEESKKLVNKVLSDGHAHLSKMAHLMSHHEVK
jgi:bacterioferritin (cytochrome b1)